MDLEVKNKEGGVVGTVTVSDYVWGVPMNGPVLHQAVVAQLANRRQGTHKVRTRGEVVGSGRKLRAQKHTGRARLGDAKAPNLYGGGIAHGPVPRDHSKGLPVKMRRLALRVALSEKVRNGTITVLDDLSVEKPSTKAIISLLGNIGVSGSTLLVTAAPTDELRKSVSNLANVDTMAVRLLSPLETHRVQHIIISREAVESADEIWGQPKPRPERKVEVARS